MAGTLQSGRNLARFVRVGGRFSPYLQPRGKSFASAILLTLVYAAIRLLEPWPLQIVLDQVVLGEPAQIPGGFDPLAWAGDPMRLLAVSAGAILVFAIAAGAAYYAQSILVARLGQQIIRDIREDVYHHMLRHSLAFHRRNEPGDLLMRLTGDMIFLREMMLAVMVTMTGEWILLLSTLALMFWVSAKLTLVTLCIAPALAFLFYFFRSRMREAARKQRKREGRIARQIGEALIAIPMIQSFTAETQEDERFRKICKRSERVGVRSAKLEAGMQRLVEVLIAVGTCLVIWFGVQEILAGRLTPGVFLVFLAYLRGLFKPLRKLGKVAERTARASAAAERILEVLEQRRDVKDSQKAKPAPDLKGAIRFSRVNFEYEDGTRALDGLSFSIEPGEQVALTGHSGAGKSTLFSLLLGFHRPSSGRIFLDDIKQRHMTLASIRQQISYLPQEPFLVAGTLRENLLYGDPNADDETIWNALDQAELAEFARNLPLGLETRVASRGQSLSGGQKQRVAMARALLKDAPILLLDEPTVGLDSATEQSVLRSLDRLRKGRTTLTIAHRPETIETAERVLEFDHGRIVRDERRAPGATPSDSNRQPSDTAPQLSPGDGSAPEIGIENLETDDLPGVARLLAPNGGTKLVQAIREFTPCPSPVRIRARKQRLGRRALLQLDHGAGTLFVKMYRSRRGDRLERSRTVEDAARSARIEVPRTLGWLDRFRALVLAEAPGQTWWELDPVRRLGLSRNLAGSLARLHRIPGPDGWTAIEPEETRLERVELRARDRKSSGWLVIADAWGAGRRALLSVQPSALSTGPVHGDLHPEQIWGTSDAEAVLLDWDLCGLGDPGRDLGNLIAHFELETLRNRWSAQEANAVCEDFLGHYLDALGESGTRKKLQQNVDWHRRITLLRLAALYSDPRFGTRPELNKADLGHRLLGLAVQQVGLSPGHSANLPGVPGLSRGIP